MPAKAAARQALGLGICRLATASTRCIAFLPGALAFVDEMLASDPQRLIGIVPLLANGAEGFAATVSVGKEFRLNLARTANDLRVHN